MFVLNTSRLDAQLNFTLYGINCGPGVLLHCRMVWDLRSTFIVKLCPVLHELLFSSPLKIFYYQQFT